MSTKTKEESIIICDKCLGHGVTTRKELIDYHHREYDKITEPCDKCDGKGRLNQVIETKVTLTKLSDK